MKITKSYLRNIIREEINNVLNEKQKSAFINILYKEGHPKTYKGIQVDFNEGDSRNKVFKSNNPNNDLKKAIAYARKEGTGTPRYSSSLDNFISDGGELDGSLFRPSWY